MDIKVFKAFTIYNTTFIVGDWVWVEKNNSNIAIEGKLVDMQSSFIAVREGEIGKLHHIKSDEIKHLGFSTKHIKQNIENREYYGLSH